MDALETFAIYRVTWPLTNRDPAKGPTEKPKRGVFWKSDANGHVFFEITSKCPAVWEAKPRFFVFVAHTPGREKETSLELDSYIAVDQVRPIDKWHRCGRVPDDLVDPLDAEIERYTQFLSGLADRPRS